MTREEISDGLQGLVSPLGGLIEQVARLPNSAGDPDFSIFSARLGDLSRSVPSVSRAASGRSVDGELDGSGGDLEPESAWLRAVAEAVERYSSCVYTPDQLRWATAEELGGDALDLDSVPRCSAVELAHPLCPLRAPDRAAPIRWVRGVSLMRLKPVWIPAVMVYLHIPWMSVGERFVLPISTGCAAHTSLEQALVNGLCEVIERDAISLVWLLQLPLPRIELGAPGGELGAFLDRYRDRCITPYLFDATTDLGVPTVYSVDIAEDDNMVCALVMCATDMDPWRAAAKVLREASSSRIALRVPRSMAQNPDLFSGVFEGAQYMATRERLPAYDFLLSSTSRVTLDDMSVMEQGDSRGNLKFLLDLLENAGMEAFAVELTTEEARRGGLRVVRAIVPALQPLSFSFRARYLAHPRLFEAPSRMDYPARSEAEFNPWPQPFA